MAATDLLPFHVHFARSEATHALERYLTGMFTEHPNQNCDTLAQVVPGTSEQSLQGLLTAMAWDEDDRNHQRVQGLLALPTEGDAALLFDDTGFAKMGLKWRSARVPPFSPDPDYLTKLIDLAMAWGKPVATRAR